MYIDSYEKTSTHFVAAEDEKQAFIKAAENESHTTLEWNDDGDAEDNGMIYSLTSVTEITPEEVRALNRMKVIYWTVTA